MVDFMLKRPMFIACTIALALAAVCTFLGIYGILVLLGTISFAAIFVIPVKFRLKKTAALSFALSIIIVLSYSLYYSFIYAPVVEYCGSKATVECVAISGVSKTENGYSVDVKCVSVRQNNVEKRTSFKTKIYLDDEIEIIPSDVLKADIVFLDDTYKFSGCHIAARSESITVERHRKSLRSVIFSIRKYVIDSVSGADDDTISFVKGMLFGDKSEVSGVFKNKFKVIGMYHVMAVSGMHLMLSVMFIDFILMLVGIGYKPRSLFAVLSALLFTVISGFSVSCLRALIIISIYYIGRFTDKLHDSLTSLGLSAFIIVLLSPYNIGNVSFILSVLATFGIIVITPVLNNLFKISSGNYIIDKILYAIKGAFTMSLGANIACIPAFMIIFKSVSLISPIANIILIVPIQMMFYLSFACVFIGKIPYLGRFVVMLIDKLYHLITICVDFLFNLKYASISAENIFFYPVFFLLIILVLGMFLYNSRFNNRHIFIFVGIYSAICAVMFFINIYLAHDVVKLSFVDVGLGSSSVITKDENAVVIDCGGDYSENIISVLSNANTKRIQLIAITHTDYDHVCYLSRLINLYEIDRIIYPKLCDITKIKNDLDRARANGTDVIAFDDDIDMSILGGAVIKAFVKRAYHLKPDRNVGSLYKFEYYNTKVVFPGDMSIFQDHAFLDYGRELDCDILLAPHHGSATSLSSEMLDIYSPVYSVISAAKDRKYGLPDKRIISKLEKRSEVLQTSELSTITFKIDKEECRYIR